MKKIKGLFSGRIARKHYFLAYLAFCIVFTIIIQIAKENGVEAYIITFSIGLLISTILDSKRLRDVEILGKIAPVVIILFLFTWIPNTYDAFKETQSFFTPHPFLNVMTLFLIVGHIYLLFAKGDQTENKYGKPTTSLPFLKAFLNAPNHVERS